MSICICIEGIHLDMYNYTHIGRLTEREEEEGRACMHTEGSGNIVTFIDGGYTYVYIEREGSVHIYIYI